MEYEHRNVKTETPSAEQFDSQSFFKEHLQRTSDGKVEIVGNDLNPVELALLETEKRRRGSQAAVAREKVRADKYELELGKVRETITQVQPQIVDESLKYADPDEYIKQQLEIQRNNPYDEVFDAANQYAQQTVSARSVQEMISEHNQNYPDKPLTEEMLNLDLPPRLLNQFEQGNMSPQDFLAQAADILHRPKEVVSPEPMGMPDLGKVGGQTTPTDDGSNDAMLANYGQAIF